MVGLFPYRSEDPCPGSKLISHTPALSTGFIRQHTLEKIPETLRTLLKLSYPSHVVKYTNLKRLNGFHTSSPRVTANLLQRRHMTILTTFLAMPSQGSTTAAPRAIYLLRDWVIFVFLYLL